MFQNAEWWRTDKVNIDKTSQGRIQRTGLAGHVLAEGTYLGQFSNFSTDLGHFIWKLLNFDIYFIFNIYLVVLGGPKHTLRAFGGMAVAPWIPLGTSTYLLTQQVQVAR